MGTTWWSAWAAVRHAVAAVLELVLPSTCAACHAVAAGPLCGSCRAGVRSASRHVAQAGPRLPAPAMPPCWAGARFEGALRLAVTAYKDEGRRDLRDVLAGLLASALADAAAADGVLRRCAALGEQVLVVPVPTARASRRRRGDDPVSDLAHVATAALAPGPPTPGLVVVPALVHTRRVADQAHLDRQSRARNLAGSMAVGAAFHAVVRGATCVVVDDVVTTGATLAEASRALYDAGARHVVAATCATTPRTSWGPPLWPSGRQTSVSA